MSDGAGFALPSVEQIAANARLVQDRVEAANRDAGLGAERPVTLVAVTKAFPPELAVAALAAGLVDLGENYAQELVAKAAVVAATAYRPRWHFIGGLQRNKVKQLAGSVALWHSVDRSSLADEIGRRAPGAEVLIQVNTTGEAQKSGCEPTGAEQLVEHARSAGLDVRGLMTVGPTAAGADPRPSFSQLRELALRCEVAELSMGMSGDFELAVAEGATIIRVGSILFGDRPPRP